VLHVEPVCPEKRSHLELFQPYATCARLPRGATILGIQRVVDLIHDDQEVKCPYRFPRLDAFRRDDIGKPVQHGVAIGNEGSSGAEDGVGFLDRRALNLPVEISLSRVTEVGPEGPDALDCVRKFNVRHASQRSASHPEDPPRTWGRSAASRPGAASLMGVGLSLGARVRPSLRSTVLVHDPQISCIVAEGELFDSRSPFVAVVRRQHGRASARAEAPQEVSYRRVVERQWRASPKQVSRAPTGDAVPVTT
jgi:hypothetical protein